MNGNFSFEQLMQAACSSTFPPPLLPQHFHPSGHQQFPQDFFQRVPPPHLSSQQVSPYFPAGENFSSDNLYSPQEYSEFASDPRNESGADHASHDDSFNRHSSYKPSGRHHIEWHSQNRGRGGKANSYIRGRGQGNYGFRGNAHFTNNSQSKHFNKKVWHAQADDMRSGRSSNELLYSYAGRRNYQSLDTAEDVQSTSGNAAGQQRKLYVKKVNDIFARNKTIPEAKKEDGANGSSVKENGEEAAEGRDRSMISYSQRGFNMHEGQVNEISVLHGRGRGPSQNGTFGHRLQVANKRWTKEQVKENDGNQRGMLWLLRERLHVYIYIKIIRSLRTLILSQLTFLNQKSMDFCLKKTLSALSFF